MNLLIPLYPPGYDVRFYLESLGTKCSSRIIAHLLMLKTSVGSIAKKSLWGGTCQEGTVASHGVRDHMLDMASTFGFTFQNYLRTVQSTECVSSKI
jgi:hypothetical protein